MIFCASFDLDGVDHLRHSADAGHNFLGDLLFVEAEQPASENKDAVVEFARNPLHGFVGTLSQALYRQFGNRGSIDRRGHGITSFHRKFSVEMDCLAASFGAR